MTDGQALLAVLAVLYLTECFFWIRACSVSFLAPWLMSWRVRSPSAMLGSADSGMVFVNPLLPLAVPYNAHFSPVSLSPEGVCAFSPQAVPGTAWREQSCAYLNHDDIDSADSDAAWLFLNGKKFVRCASPGQSRSIVTLVKRLRQTEESARTQLIESHIKAGFDDAAATKRMAEGAKEIREIAWFGTTFLGVIFVYLPVLVILHGMMQVAILGGLVLYGLGMVIAILFYRAHSRLIPGGRWDRIASLSKMLLCPPIAIRAADHLSVGLLDRYNPLVVGRVLAGERGLENGSAALGFMAGVLRDLAYPPGDNLESAAGKTVKWFRERLLQRAQAWSEGVSGLDDIFHAPAREENDRTYCPRCHCTFLHDEGDCADCPGVGLLPFTTQTGAGQDQP